MQLYTRKYGTDVVTTHVDEDVRFDLRDNKGRQIGIALLITSAEFYASADSGYRLPHGGVWFMCGADATRGGLRYGASKGIHFEPTLEAAKAWCKSRAASTLKSYARKFG